MSFWAAWAFFLWFQQFTLLFSGRAKNSGSLEYSAFAGLFSHMSWFMSNVFFVGAIIDYRDAPWPVKLGVGLFYTVFAISGTVSAQYLALRLEKGALRPGAEKA